MDTSSFPFSTQALMSTHSLVRTMRNLSLWALIPSFMGVFVAGGQQSGFFHLHMHWENILKLSFGAMPICIANAVLMAWIRRHILVPRIMKASVQCSSPMPLTVVKAPA